jgi:ribosomal 50S subunit-associated protein YjgA (DUF615 family)
MSNLIRSDDLPADRPDDPAAADSTPDTPDSTDDDSYRGRIGREYLEKALDKGPSALAQQIRYVLMLSQIFGGEPVTTPYPEAPVSTRHARLKLLARLTDTLDDHHLQALLHDVQQIGDATVRLPLLTELAPYLSMERLHSVLRTIWRQLEAIVDPVVRARTLYALAPLLDDLDNDPRTPSALRRILQHAENITQTEARLRSLVALVPHLPDNMTVETCETILNTLQESNSDALCSKTLVALAPHLPPVLEDKAFQIATAIDNPAELARTLTGLARHLRQDALPRVRDVAVEAIRVIEPEDDRAEALIEFAPYLEEAHMDADGFPQVLEKALRIAIHIIRRDTRARILVALAPHLTPDLQREALAAVHALGNEQDRAYLLAQLAPHLPDEMQMAGLKIADALQAPDARAHAFMQLAASVPEHARLQTLQDALTAACDLPHYYERVQALLRLTDRLPHDLHQQALVHALDAARRIENEHARARALSTLGSYLPPPLLSEALAATQTVQDPEKRLNACYGLVAYLPPGDVQQQAIQEMMHASRQLLPDYKRARALVGIIPHVDDSRLPEIRVLADKLDDPIDRLNVYIALIDRVTESGHLDQLMHRAWRCFLRIDDGYDRASSLAALAPHLPDERRAQVPQMILSLVQSISDGYDKAIAIGLLVHLLVDGDAPPALLLPDSHMALQQGLLAALTIPQQQIRTDMVEEGALRWVTHISSSEQTVALWQQLAPQLANLPLPDVLLCLGALLPILKQLAPHGGLQSIAQLMGMD